MPQRSDWILFEGEHATRRGVNMVREARRLFTARTGKPGPGISQGGKSGSVGASGGTHLREAFDFRTASYSPALCRVWEDCLWEVGFAAWWRPYVFNLWPQHHHAIPKGGDLSSSAANQEKAFENRRNGLRSNLSYPRIGKYAYRTWEQYQKLKPKPLPPKLGKIRVAGTLYSDIPYVSLWWLLKARQSKNLSRHVYHVQRWLDRIGLFKATKDGKWDPSTQQAFDRFRRSLGWPEKDCVGPPGWTSLSALHKKAKTLKPLKKGK